MELFVSTERTGNDRMNDYIDIDGKKLVDDTGRIIYGEDKHSLLSSFEIQRKMQGRCKHRTVMVHLVTKSSIDLHTYS